MSRKLILALTAVTLGSLALGTVAAEAFPARGGKSFAHTPPQHIKVLVREPHGPHGPHLPPPVWIHHPHWHHGGVYMVDGRPVYDAVPAVSTAPGPCSCLTKDYTDEGLVIFKDICTKESATTVVPGSPAAAQLQQQQQPQTETAPSPQQSGETAAPSSFAGKTYQDFLASQQAVTKQN
jgi:hypothetical protein